MTRRDRRRRAQALAAGLLTMVASTAAFGSDCADWKLAGYRIGMSREDALAVRGGKLERSGTLLRPKIQGGGKVQVEFNADGKIDQVSLRTDRPAPEVKLTLSLRIGNPLADSDSKQTRWESEICAMDLHMHPVNADGEDVVQTDVFLVAHGSRPRAPRP